MLRLGQFAKIKKKLMSWQNETWHEQFGSWSSNLASTADNLKVGICSCILDVWSWWTRTGENRGPSAGPTIIGLPGCQNSSNFEIKTTFDRQSGGGVHLYEWAEDEWMQIPLVIIYFQFDWIAGLLFFQPISKSKCTAAGWEEVSWLIQLINE